MALFKIFKGSKDNLGVTGGTDKVYDGYAYFTPDNGKFYIDVVPEGQDGDPVNPGINRIPLSADKADKDDLGNIIKNAYAASLNLAGHTLKLMAKDGTTVLTTITLPDNNTTYTIATGDANGQIKVTPSSGNAYNVNVKGLGSNAFNSTDFLPRNSELLTTNPFAPNILKGPYISKIDNALYAADKRWTVTSTNISGISNLFDGNYDTHNIISNGDTAIITIDFSDEPTGYFPGYPYGYFLISFYYAALPANVSGRVYCNYATQGVGWHDISFSPVSGSGSTNTVYRSDH